MKASLLRHVFQTRPFEYLRLTSLGVIGALVKTDEQVKMSFTSQFLQVHIYKSIFTSPHLQVHTYKSLFASPNS